ncbi:MAG: hypothetical protein ACREPN_05120 [Rudaea sp.]
MKFRTSPNLKSTACNLLAMLFLASAGFFLLTTLCAVVNFAWLQPMFDQWRSYYTLLTLPFPQNVLQLENGHRPILPNLVRLAEIHWFAANQLLQISVGACCAISTSAILAVAAWRERSLPVIARSAGVLLGVLAIFWLGNSRMLLHGNELLHAYSIMLLLVVACLSTWRAHTTGSIAWFGAANVACVAATFCFGPGIATFAAIFLLAFTLRLPWRWLLLPLGAMAVCLILYLFVLPGDRGVREMLGVRPLESLRVAAQWLSAPWVNGWLGLADPPASWVVVDKTSLLGHMVADSANTVVAASTLRWRTLSVLIGFAGISLFLVRLWFLHTRRQMTRLQALAVGVAVFALAISAEISIGRLDYFRTNADQVYADRYLLWSSLFWSSLGLLVLVDVAQSGKRWLKYSGAAFLVALPLILSATQVMQAGWGSIVYRSGQRTAAALRSGVFDEKYFPGNGTTDADFEEDLRLLNLLRVRHLAMFADPAWQQVGKYWIGILSVNHDFVVEVQAADAFTDTYDHLRAARFAGVVKTGISGIEKSGQLAVLADDNTIAGVAEFSFIAPGAPAFRLDVPRKRGFDGYIRNYQPDKTYRLAVIDFAHHQGVLLAPQIPALK